jgi:ATP-dependent helicase/nuclease subunit B
MTNGKFLDGDVSPGSASGEGDLLDQSGLNTFTSALTNVCRGDPLREKWLIAPSLRVGHQWLDTVAMNGCPVLNCRIKTVKGMALELAGPQMARRGLSLVSSTGSLVLIDGILCRLAPSAYLAGAPVGPGLCKTVLAAVEGMRLAGMVPDDLDSSCFEEPRKAEDLAFIVSAYMDALQGRGLLDYAAVLHLAASELCDGAAQLGMVLVLIPENHDFSSAERILVENIRETVLRMVPMDRPVRGQTASGRCTDLALLKWLLHPAAAPAASRDGTVSIFHAVGEVNEVREVFRRCLAQGYRWDQVELLHTDARTYVPLIYETFLGLHRDGETSASPLPVTFAEGIPTTYSRPGRALTGWMQWMRENFLQTTLCRMLEDGLLKVPDMEGNEHTVGRLGSLLRGLPIGWGRERYAERLDDLLKEPREQPSPFMEEAAASPPGQDSDGLRLLRMLVGELLEISPSAQATQVQVLQAAVAFLTKVARSENEADNYARQALVEKIEDMAAWIERAAECREATSCLECGGGEVGETTGGAVCLDVRAWLEALPAEVWVEGSGPRPGRLHVANVASGGMSGRTHTFIIGLDDGRFPAAGLNDPLLLDIERARLSPELPTAAQLLSRKLERFTTLLAGLRGTATLGFSSLDLASDRAAFPSPVVFSAFRILSENRDADQTDLMRWLGMPASFAPTFADHCLEETEWWLWRLCAADAVQDPRDMVEARFAHFARARAAIQHRRSREFTVYDGKIPDLPVELDPLSASGPLMSAAKLETIGQCPLRYFFTYVLRIEPARELTPDPRRWLDGAEFGELLHEVFYQFMSELLRERRLPSFERDMGRLASILEEQVNGYTRRHPPYSPSAFRQQDMQLLQAARIFLLEEEALCRTHRPMFLEVSLGMRSARPVGPLDVHEPVLLPLQDGRSIRVRGRLDRVDRIGEAADAPFAICDYKTGSDFKFTQADPFWEGRVIQHALYVAIAAAVLRRKISGTARVAHFEFFFPNVSGRGRRIRLPAEQAEQANRIIDDLCRTVSHGCFLATTNSTDDCRFCDYVPICGDVEDVARWAALKIENSPDPTLEPLRELRNRGNRSSR